MPPTRTNDRHASTASCRAEAETRRTSGLCRRCASGRTLAEGNGGPDETDGKLRGNGIGARGGRRTRHRRVVAIVARLDRRVRVMTAADPLAGGVDDAPVGG